MSCKRLNYTGEDKQLLASIVGKYWDIVENKKSSHTANLEKSKAWQEISDLYNDANAVPRDTASLRKLWNNMKQEAKRNSTKEKSETSTTETPSSSNDVLVNKKGSQEILETDFIENPIKIEEDIDYAATVDEIINSALPPETALCENVLATEVEMQQEEMETKHEIFYKSLDNSRRRSSEERIDCLSALEQAKIDVLNVKKLAAQQLIRHKEELHQLKVEKKKKLNELQFQHQEALLKLELEAKMLEFSKYNK